MQYNYVDVIESMQLRIDSMEEEKALLTTRLKLLENVFNVLEDTTNKLVTDVEISVNGKYTLISKF